MKRLLSSLLFFVLFSLCCSCEAKTLEVLDALLVLDMKSDIKTSSQNNGALMLQALKEVAKTCHMRLRLSILADRSASEKNISKWFQEARKRSHSVLFFYFSGHGTKNHSGIPWPFIYFSRKNQLLDMKTITALVESMPARLSIVLSDCCNSAESVTSTEPRTKEALSFDQKKFTRGARKLFLHTRGHIRATAATPGQFGVATDKGSFFTLSFLLSLVDTCQSNNPSWNDLFNTTASLCTSFNARLSHILQIPYVEVEVE